MLAPGKEKHTICIIVGMIVSATTSKELTLEVYKCKERDELGLNGIIIKGITSPN